MENSVLPLVWKLYFEELSSAVHSQFSTHFVPRRLHSPSSTLTFHFQKEKRDDTLTLAPAIFANLFPWYSSIRAGPCEKKLLRISVNDTYCTAEPRYRSSTKTLEDDYSRQKYPSKADSVDFSGKRKTLLSRYTFESPSLEISLSPAIDNASTIQGIFCQSNFAIINAALVVQDRPIINLGHSSRGESIRRG